MRPWLAPGAAFATSLALSAATVGRHVYWQDSGFYLAAVHDLAALYPHGFVLYELLCRAWTGLFFFVDFALAVHLFSSACAAGASAALALAVRDLLRARGSRFAISTEDSGDLADWAGAASGVLAASGYTFWISGIYAKGYAFSYLVLALLLWRMIRAAESRRPRDFTRVAALIGLAWQAHPSAVGAGVALLGFVAFFHRELGWRGILWRAGVAAALAAGPLLLLPILARNESPAAFGRPDSAAELLRYATGSRFLGTDSFDWGGGRWSTAAAFAWEDFLGVGLLLVALGGILLLRANRTLLAGVLLWVVPFTLGTTFFALEGQQDHWYVAAWMPLHLLAGAGVAGLARAAGKRGKAAVVATGAAGLVWAVAANGGDLRQRGYDLADRFGRMHLEPLAPDAILLVTSDDASSTTQYLQRVRGVRPDVLVVRLGQIGSPWYQELLARREARLVFPPAPRTARTAAFLNANGLRGRPLYVEEPPPPGLLRPDLALVPAGPLWRVAARGEARLEPWPLPMEPEAVRPLFRRARGQVREDGSYRAEPYERRLFVALLRARLHRAEWKLRHGEPAAARDLYASILRADPETAEAPEVVNPLGEAHLELGNRASSPEDARAHYRAGLAVPNLDPRLRDELRRRLGAP